MTEEPLILSKEDIDLILGYSSQSVATGAETVNPSPTIQAEYLVITAEDLGPEGFSGGYSGLEPALVISLDELIVPVEILEPKEGHEAKKRIIDVVGRTGPKAWIKYTLNGKDGPVTEAGPDGGFRIRGVRLADGDNELILRCVNEPVSLSQPAMLHVKLKLPPYLGLRDWFTREKLEIGSDVVRCKNRDCERYVLRLTWESEGCYCGNKGPKYYTPDQPEFFQANDQAIQI